MFRAFFPDHDPRGPAQRADRAPSGLAGNAEPVKATGDIKPPKILKMIKPVYPEEARKEGIEGVVILEATADARGRVENAKVLRSIPALDQAAIDAVKQWVYEPLILDGKPTPVIFTVTVRFLLK
jgi:periplasmic protein TonB